MALDNANFISELSIVDPPGSDPLSQGDDQIRTIKRATQQSFPLVAAAVNITDVQMNLMAIKNEANVFSVSANSFAETTIFQGGGTGSPTLSFQQLTVVKWHIRAQLVGDALDFRRFVAGVFQDVPMSLDNTTGVVDFLQVPTVQGAPLWVAGELRIFVVNTTPGTNWFVADGLNGTVNLDNRILTAEGLSPVGTNLAPNLVGTAAGGVSGATAISEAQMPSHHHKFSMGDFSGGVIPLGDAAGIVTYGLQNPITNLRFSDNSGGGNRMIDKAGSSQSHTHTDPAAGVVENGSDRNTVRPFSRTVQYHQYVP